MTPRILLSVPHMGGAQQSYVAEAFATNWLSTVGPNIEGFENEFAAHIGMPVILLKTDLLRAPRLAHRERAGDRHVALNRLERKCNPPIGGGRTTAAA